MFITALIRDNYCAVFFTLVFGIPVALVIYIHSVAAVKRSICLYADKAETHNNVLTCVRTAVDSLRIFSC